MDKTFSYILYFIRVIYETVCYKHTQTHTLTQYTKEIIYTHSTHETKQKPKDTFFSFTF